MMRKTNILFLIIGAFGIVLYLCSKPKPVPVRPEQNEVQADRVAVEPISISSLQPELEPKPALVPTKIQVSAKSLIERIAAGDTNAYHLQPDQILAFLVRNQTNGEALLAAFNVSRDPHFLREDARRYPKDP